MGSYTETLYKCNCEHLNITVNHESIRNNNWNIVYLDVSFTMAELQEQNRVRFFSLMELFCISFSLSILIL